MPSDLRTFGERLDDEEPLLAACRERGIDVEAHLCACEVCLRSSLLCTATRSSLAMELAMRIQDELLGRKATNG